MRKSEKIMIEKAQAVIHILKKLPKERKLPEQKEIDRAVEELDESIARVKGVVYEPQI